jgi:MATE family multidrug resistance protein
MTGPEPITYSLLLQRAWPIILANAAVPLLGLADTAVIGNVGTVADLGAIAFGSLIFSFVYWSFGFLRMGTTGFTAQAAGAGDEQEVRRLSGVPCLWRWYSGCC